MSMTLLQQRFHKSLGTNLLYGPAINFNNHSSLSIASINIFLSKGDNSVTGASEKLIFLYW